MHTVIIQNFGPIKNAEIDLDKSFQVLIGTQASGKSTICKVCYFCLKIRDYTLNFLLDSNQFTANHQNEYFNNYLKYLTKQFMGCFGTTKHMRSFVIRYRFADHSIEIKLNSDGYVRFSFDRNLRAELLRVLSETGDLFVNRLDRDGIASIVDNITAVGVMKKHLGDRMWRLFDDEKEIIYIPAGRSLLATMSEQLHDVSISEMDLTMQEFIGLIRSTRNKFGSKIPEMTKNFTKTVKGQVNNMVLNQAYDLIRSILKADYTSENDGEKIYFDESHWVKLMYGSSGQQEILWILMLIYISILEDKNTFFVIEEPEAHLFPVAQREVVNLIALLVNATDSKVIITTHSPYVLTSCNILLYADKVEGKRRGNNAVIPKNVRLPYHKCAAYEVGIETTYMKSIMDSESHMISTSYIDSVSSITNEELDSLMDMELENDL